MKISTSILAAELIHLKNTLESMDPEIIDFIHLDIMDGHFVPQLSFGEGYAREIAQAVSIPLDVHLMVANPEREAPKYFSCKPRFLSFHVEAAQAPVRLAQSIREEGIGAGLALSPGTPLERVEPLLDEIDLLLLMCVEPGYYGQSFLPKSLERIRRLCASISNKKIFIEVDGGIKVQNIAEVKKAGADIAVAGSACFEGPDVNASTLSLKEACDIK